MKPLVLILFTLVIICNSFSATLAQQPKTPADLRSMAADYYNWRNENFPVASSDAGLHTWDNRLTDYSLSAVLARRLYAKEILAKVDAMPAGGWSKEDRWGCFLQSSNGL